MVSQSAGRTATSTSTSTSTGSKSSRKHATHERILATAARAIRRGGYAGVGVADIMKEAGLTHGGFYAHFASRDAMLVEAMEHAGAESGARLAARATAARQRGVSPLQALIVSYLSDAHLAAPESGCAVAALVGEMPRQAAAVRDAARQRVQGLLASVRQALPAAADEGQVALLAASLVGAIQLARAVGNNAQGKAMLAGARQALLARHDTGSNA